MRPRLALFLALTVASAGCFAALNPAKPGTGDTWPLASIQSVGLVDQGLTGKGVTIAIIDTGIDLTHPEFKAFTQRGVQWADLVNGRNDAYDDNGHGTHVASIIVAGGNWQTLLTSSSFYLRGVATGVNLIVIKAIAADGTGEEPKVAQGIETAVANGADVIVLSLGGGTIPVLGTQTESAVNRAIDRGVFVVAAAGNKRDDESSCTVTSPASVARVIAVGAVDQAERIGDFSCRGENDGTLIPPSPGRGDPNKKPEVVAPGVKILGAWCTRVCAKPSEYVEASGTSQAAPYVAGVIALLLEENPEMKRTGNDREVQRVKDVLMTRSKKVGPLSGQGSTAHSDLYGYGLIQAEAVLRALR